MAMGCRVACRSSGLLLWLLCFPGCDALFAASRSKLAQQSSRLRKHLPGLVQGLRTPSAPDISKVLLNKKRAALRAREARARKLLNLPSAAAANGPQNRVQRHRAGAPDQARTRLLRASNKALGLGASRDVMISYFLAEDFDTAGLVAALPGRAVLVGDVAAIGVSAAKRAADDASPEFDRLVDDADAGPPIAFVFPFGGAVLWGFDDAETQALLALLVKNFATGPLQPDQQPDTDRMAFRGLNAAERLEFSEKTEKTEGEAEEPVAESRLEVGLKELYAPPPGRRFNAMRTGFGGRYEAEDLEAQEARPEIAISGRQLGGGSSFTLFALSDVRDALMKLSVSYAFAQSARLATLEAAVDDLIDDVSPIPEALAATGRCTALSPKNVGKLDGRAFFLSSALNLYSDILDVPDFFWEKEDYQPVYERTASYLDVPKRVDILNARLDVVQRLLENLNSRLDVSKSTRLEWVIIVLIVLEVVHIYDPVIRSAGLLSSKFLQKMLLR